MVANVQVVAGLEALEARIMAEIARRQGKLQRGEWLLLCPLHSERSPSFYYRPGVGFICFGCKAEGGIKDAARAFGLEPGSAALSAEDRERLEADRRAVMELRQEEQRLAGLALTEYWAHSDAAAELRRHENALATLAREGIGRLAVDHFGIGWATYGIDGVGYPALTIPWRYRNEVRAVQYRILADDVPGGRYRWHKGSRPTLFNADVVTDPVDDLLVVVEGAKKAAACWEHGLESVCAITNKGGWNPAWAPWVAGFRDVVFALDPDAGAEALAAARTVPGARVARLPRKPDDMLVESGGDIEQLMAYIGAARRAD
jgi:DNA primase